MSKKLKLKEADLAWISTSGRRSGRATVRQPRSLDISSFSFVVTHRPTNLSVKGELPEGHYSRQDVAKFKEKLLTQLEAAISKAKK